VNLDIATDLCMRWEGFSSKPYLCPAGVPTIGYGATHYADGRRVTMDDSPISKEEARLLLAAELFERYAPGVVRQCPGLLALAVYEDDWKKFNAIVDFAYNLGVGNLQISTLRKKINTQDWEAARYQLSRWVRAGGRILPGLVKRRAAEAELLL